MEKRYIIVLVFDNNFRLNVNTAKNEKQAKRIIEYLLDDYAEELSGAHEGHYESTARVPITFNWELSDYQKRSGYGPCATNIKIEQKYLEEIQNESKISVPQITAIESMPVNFEESPD